MPTPDNDFTQSQAEDLAKYFMGSSWTAFMGVGIGDRFLLLDTGSACTFYAPTWRAAFRAAGVKLPYRPRFASIGPRVLFDGEQVAVCKSGNFATRTANALNAYEPDSRGQ